MGYHVTILRTDKGKQLPISLEEIVSATSGIDGWRHLDSPPTFEFHDKEGSCTLWYQGGELWTKNPQEWHLGVMVALVNRYAREVFEVFRSSKSMPSPELISLLKGSFLLGYSIGGIGFTCLLLLAFRNEDIFVVGAVAIVPLLLALLMNVLYRRILSELSDRLGASLR